VQVAVEAERSKPESQVLAVRAAAVRVVSLVQLEPLEPQTQVPAAVAEAIQRPL
jgi:hypothetical protein